MLYFTNYGKLYIHATLAGAVVEKLAALLTGGGQALWAGSSYR